MYSPKTHNYLLSRSSNDYDSLSTPDSDIVPDGYQRLSEIETETKVTVHRSNDDDFGHNKYGRSDEKKIKLSLSQEQISGRKLENTAGSLMDIKKSHSAFFDFSGVKTDGLTRSSSMKINEFKNIDLQTNNLFSYIYDKPRRISVPAVSSPPDYIPPICTTAASLNNRYVLFKFYYKIKIIKNQ